MITGTIELRNGERVSAHYSYTPVHVGQIISLDSASDFREYEITELLDAVPQSYISCNTGERKEMPIYAYRTAPHMAKVGA